MNTRNAFSVEGTATVILWKGIISLEGQGARNPRCTDLWSGYAVSVAIGLEGIQHIKTVR